ncbi:MAG TPA: electron transfer flavoprotein subunit beta/FixA family protein [Candidatus Thermoplasmatota archaeon]|nr:electron transfer flavoprotein subunit beta/FixA family protein [Candidatus Thermoplasmatota archaeon]
MEYVVLVKGVPDFRQGKVKFKEDNTLDRGNTPTVLNPNDQFALQAALEAKVKHGGTVHVLTMGPPNYKKILQEAMSIYADKCYLLSDRKMGGADTLATAETIAGAVRKIGNVDMIFAGFKSADGETGQTGPQTAWKLGWPVVTHVLNWRVEGERLVAERTAYDEIEEVEAPLPAFIVTDPGFKPVYRQATHRLKLQDLQEQTQARLSEFDRHFAAWTAADLALDEKKIGFKGSPTIVRTVEPIPRAPQERKATVYDGAKDEDVKAVAKAIVAAVKA